MTKKEIQALFTQYTGDFKLMTLNEYENLKKMRAVLALTTRVLKTIFCTDEKQAYVIAKVA